jgi:mRNA-degrading endonuclease RelE of RelBE toxin-antitoxin system
MNFTIKTLGFFKEQVKHLDKKSRRIIYDKIQLLKENPYRYKKIHSKLYPKIFRIRLNIQSKETRLIYVVIEPNIILVCLLERKRDYKDLERYLDNLKKELGL